MAGRDDSEFRAFVSHRWAALLRTAYLVTADAHLAEDCVQEALTKVHRQWGRLGGNGDPVAYARRAVFNAALSWRRRRRITEVPLSAADDPAAVEQSPQDLDPQLVAALRALPPRMRAAVVLRYVEDCSEAEAAALLSCSVGTIKSAAHRGLVRLRTSLEAASSPHDLEKAGDNHDR